MFAFAGLLGILIALGGSVALVWHGTRRRAEPSSLKVAARFVLIGGGVAFLALEAALLANDFTLEYVANHHSRDTPFPFNLATGWAALEGSIVLWGLVLAVFTWGVLRRYLREPSRLGAGAMAVMGAVGIFFFGLQLTVADPFRICVDAVANGCVASSPFPWAAAIAPPNGPGPNPLLQNHILMAVHPPMLYLGYVGLTVPFAYAISALALGQPGTDWLRLSRRSSLLAWTFLSMGIVLGAWWAYEVLSWGGYWAWDPVENASFMPWLIATAFLHSSLVQLRRQALQSWNFVLVITAFALTILGTFLTRSGTVASVHSFTQSAIGPVLLGFLFLVLVGSLTLFAARVPMLDRAARLETLVSREGGFLLNNLLLCVYAFVVVAGTLYPIVLEAVTGARVSVGEPFFNRLAVPLSFGLLLAMGVGPLLPWRQADPVAVADRLRLPVGIALFTGLIAAVTISRLGYVVLAVVIGTYVIAVAVTNLVERSAKSSAIRGEPLFAGVRRQLTSEPSFWAGQLSHCGVALTVIGLALAANLGLQTDVTMAPGDTVDFGGYELTYRSPFLFTEPNRRVQGATIAVADRAGNPVTELAPRANYFGADTSGITTPAVHSTWKGDLYLTLLNIDGEGILLRLNTSPGIWLLWMGGLTVGAGGIWSLSARRRTREPSLVA
ncbi:MAG: heme lyase CcmF/NrfE family subunit [Acidimicrobiia bacterium]|nr:heme lyase CcmF/NrfE family subunit [Acidimicrobiia bacterium]